METIANEQGLMCTLHHCHPTISFNPMALRKTKIVYNFGLSECNRVNMTSFIITTHNSRQGKESKHQTLCLGFSSFFFTSSVFGVESPNISSSSSSSNIPPPTLAFDVSVTSRAWLFKTNDVVS